MRRTIGAQQSLMAFLAMIGALLAGCSSTSIDVDRDASVDTGQYRTYRWAGVERGPAGATTPTGVRRPQTLLDQRVKAAVENELQAKGLKPAPQGTQPDFLVMYYVKTQQELVPASSYGIDYVGGGWGGVADLPSSYTEGTLVVDFVDPKTNKVFWHGVASSVLNSSQDNSKRVQSAVKDMMAKYP